VPKNENICVIGISARAFAQSFVAAGFTVTAIDRFGDTDLQRIANTELFPNSADWSAPLAAAGKMPWVAAGGVENRIELIEQFESRHCGPSPSAYRRLRDHVALLGELSSSGFTTPETRAQVDCTVLDAKSARRWLWKPFDSAAGLGIDRVDAASLRSERRGSWRRGYWQRFVPGDVFSAAYVSDQSGNSQLLGVCRQFSGPRWGAPRPFQFVGGVGPVDIPPAVTRELQRLGDWLTTHIGVCGVWSVDWVMADRRPCVLEVNPRYAANMELLERALGISIAELHIAGCRGKVDSLQLRSPPERIGKAVVYADRPCRIDERLRGVCGRKQNRKLTWIADLPAGGQRLVRGEPVLTVFAAGPTELTVAERLQTRRRAVHSCLC
jgi:predicted ATP-grasp superfamily ATP-dependent carboligase